MEDKDTYFEMYNVIKKNRIARTNKNGSYASTMPAEVATALPPLKLAKMGNICPITATNPMINGCISAPNNPGRSVANVPFRISISVTVIPGLIPKIRKVLVAPKFLLPCSRISNFIKSFTNN